MQMHTADAFGAVTVVCTARTGTLTGEAMTVTDIRTLARAYGVTGQGYEPSGAFVSGGRRVDAAADPDLRLALSIAAVANRGDVIMTDRGWAPRGDPLEAALVVAARKAGIERPDTLASAPEIGEVPFSTERRLMATFHRSLRDASIIALVKGDPERVLLLCRRVQSDGVEGPLDEASLASIRSENHRMAIRGLHVLAVACGRVAVPQEWALAGLTFVGLIGVLDPPAAGVPEAIEAFRKAGVRTVMMTGDQREAAAAAAGELGLDYGSGTALDARNVDRMSDDTLRERLPHVNVFSRVTPQAMERIVAGLEARGEVVAMVEDNRALEALGAAIQEGRVVQDNIRKFVFYLFSCGLAGTLLFVGAAVSGWPVPMLMAQALWLSLVTAAFPALALTAEPAQPDVMHRPPRSLRAALSSPTFFRAILFYATLLAAATLFVVAWSRYAGIPAGRAITMNFMALALAQLLHLGNARDSGPVLSAKRATANAFALTAVGVALALQVLAVGTAPLRHVLHLEPLTSGDWVVVVLAGLMPAVAGQVLKSFRRDIAG